MWVPLAGAVSRQSQLLRKATPADKPAAAERQQAGPRKPLLP